MDRPRPPFTAFATEFRSFPSSLPEQPVELEVTDMPGSNVNSTLVATDGKKDDEECRWGVGVVDLHRGLGHYMGGAYLGLDPDLLMRNGELDQATVETLALHGSLTWARKREIVRYEAFRMNGFRPLGREVIFVTDRMSTLQTMRKTTGGVGRGTYVQGFRRAFDAVADALKLLMLVRTVRFVHKSHWPSQVNYAPTEWIPDVLAARGMEHGNARLRLPQSEYILDVIHWTNDRWSEDRKLLLSWGEDGAAYRRYL